VVLDDFTEFQPENVTKIINAFLKNHKLISKDGTINHSAIKKCTGLSIHYTNKAVADLKNSFKRNYEAY